jgi:IPT/TIG domain
MGTRRAPSGMAIQPGGPIQTRLLMRRASRAPTGPTVTAPGQVAAFADGRADPTATRRSGRPRHLRVSIERPPIVFRPEGNRVMKNSCSRPRAVLTLISCIAAVLTACGGTDPGSTAPPGTAPDPTASASPPASSTPNTTPTPTPNPTPNPTPTPTPTPAGPPPVILALSQTGAPPAGGTIIVIAGTGLSASASVTFGGVAAVSVARDAATGALVAVTPAHADGLVDLVVTNPDGQSAVQHAFRFGPPPAPTSFSPGTVTAPGTLVTVSGADFTSVEGVQVAVGGVLAPILAKSTTALVVSAPKMNPGSYVVSVANYDGQVATIRGAFLVYPGP